MEQETRKFAIEQAIKLVSVRQDITDKTKAVFDLADDIVKYIGDQSKYADTPTIKLPPDWMETVTERQKKYNPYKSE